MPLADYIELGVFSGEKGEEKPLYMKREKITQEQGTLPWWWTANPPVQGSILITN